MALYTRMKIHSVSILHYISTCVYTHVHIYVHSTIHAECLNEQDAVLCNYVYINLIHLAKNVAGIPHKKPYTCTY